MSHDVIRRLLDDAYRAQGSMSVGPPTVKVDASHLHSLLASHDYYKSRAKRYIKALSQIIDTREGNDDSISVDPAEIARAALENEQEQGE